MGKNRKPIYGVGINDSNSHFTKVSGNYYQTWRDMITRCYSFKYQARFKTYIGCSVSTEWLKFSTFQSWMETQEWQDKQLDKDILVFGNKIYSRENCVFVSCELNYFLLDSGATRGEWSIGSGWSKKNSRFYPRCRNPFTKKNEYLGSFANSIDAHEAWRYRKREHAMRYADIQTDQRIADALRIRY